MTRMPADEPVDERLRQLLAVEQRLEERVRSAEADAARRIADARTHAERVQADARQQRTRDEEEQARADDAAHALALASIQHEHEAVLREIADVADARIDELARRALDRAIGGSGGAA